MTTLTTGALFAMLALLALGHLYFLYLEMFAWTKPSTVKTFGVTPEFAEQSRVLAANQGLYNGFLAAGLIWALLAPQDLRKPVALFFSACVLAAGLYGGATASKRIFIVQALPGALTLLLAIAAQ